MNDSFDFGFDLDELSPVDDASEMAREFFQSGDLTVLSQHHITPNSFVLAHDRSVTWGMPGQPQLVAIAVARDLQRSTYAFETSRHATAPFAQNWLAERGCPLDRISLRGRGFVEPADDLTLKVEQQIQKSGARYEVLDTCTSDDAPGEAWTLVRDSRAGKAPVRLFHEAWDHTAGTYSMREGAFADVDVAHASLDQRSDPLPEPPEYSGQDGAVVRARVASMALARSASASETPRAGLDSGGATPAAPDRCPAPGRLL